jgi:hypothetical protein
MGGKKKSKYLHRYIRENICLYTVFEMKTYMRNKAGSLYIFTRKANAAHATHVRLHST